MADLDVGMGAMVDGKRGGKMTVVGGGDMAETREGCDKRRHIGSENYSGKLKEDREDSSGAVDSVDYGN